MGLAPYGNPTSPDVDRYCELIKKELAEINEDGSIWLDQQYFDYATGLKMVNEAKWEALFGIKTRRPTRNSTL
jgi:carbamoyltransferase